MASKQFGGKNSCIYMLLTYRLCDLFIVMINLNYKPSRSLLAAFIHIASAHKLLYESGPHILMQIQSLGELVESLLKTPGHYPQRL